MRAGRELNREVKEKGREEEVFEGPTAVCTSSQQSLNITIFPIELTCCNSLITKS